jgi:hypothetical protein
MSVMNIPLRLAAVLAISSLMLLAGCGEQAKIALPDASLESDELPSIEISALVEEGSANKPTINSASGANPETVFVKSEGRFPNSCPYVNFSTVANHPVLGIRYLRIRVIKGGVVLQEVVREQFADQNGQIFASLGIVGTAQGSATTPGVMSGIRARVARPVRVEVFAMSYNWKARTFQGLYRCKAYEDNPRWFNYDPLPGNPGTPNFPTPSPSSSMSPSPAPSPSAVIPINGNFVLIAATSSSSGQNIGSNPAGYKALIGNTGGTVFNKSVAISNTSGSLSRPFTFAWGMVPPLQNAFGGFSFDHNAKFGVIATLSPSATTPTKRGAFLLVALPGALSGSGPIPAIDVYMQDPTDPSSTQYVEPRLFMSPDSTLAVAVGAPVGGPGLYSIAAYDLRSGSAVLIGTARVGKEFFGAKVQGPKIIAQLEGATIEFAIP